MSGLVWRVVILVSLALGALARAQPAPNVLTGERETVSVAAINAELAKLKPEVDDHDLPDAQHDEAEQAWNHYQQALASLELAATQRKSAAAFATETRDAPSKLAAIREELAKAPEPPKVEPTPDATLAQLEQQLAQAVRDLETARKESTDLAGEASRRDQRRRAIQDRTQELRREKGEIDESLAAPLSEGEGPRVAAARRTALRARRQAVDAELAALEAETASYDARRELLPARQDRALRRVQQGEALVGEWQRVVNARREQEAAQAASDAKRLRHEAARQHPVLRDFAAASERLAAQSAGEQGLPAKINAASQLSLETSARLAKIRASRKETQDRIQESGLNRATGLMLRQQFDELPDTTELRRRIADTDRALAANALELQERSDDRRGAGDIDRIARELMAEIEQDGEVENHADLEAVAKDLATARRDLLDALIASRETYDERLRQLQENLDALLDESVQYRSLIEEHILWVRSVAGDPLPTRRDLRSAVEWVTAPGAWRSGLEQALGELQRRWATVAPSLIAVLLLIGVGYAARRRLRVVAKGVGSYRTDSYTLTLRALLLTVVIASGGPALLWWIAWLLRSPGVESAPVRALGAGLETAALVWAPLALLRHTLRPNGLGVTHFRWRPALARAIRTRLRWFTPIALVTTTIVVGLAHAGSEDAYTVFGRAAFSIGMLASSVLFAGLLRPSGQTLTPFLERNKGGWIDRLRFIWYPSAVLLPIALAALAWAGYFYTAIRLESRLAGTIALVLALVAINAMLARWLFIERRRVAVENARRRREQAATSEGSAGAATEGVPIEEDRLDLPAISSQTRQLFRAGVAIAAILGFLFIWSDVAPALRILDRVQVYPTPTYLGSAGATDTATDTPRATTPPPDASRPDASPTVGAAANPLLQQTARQTDGQGATDPNDAKAVSVTLADIGAALLLLIATWIVFRNLPGLVEIVLLQRLPLDAGSRYALSTVLRYSIAIIGVAAAFGAIEIPWSKVQWLAAALTFGLAFGLQEIFANFVSGLIILAERPFRVGDTVTVNSVSGSVSRIRMRATTITDWDLKELVIPNKTFITGEVINWTLTDPTLRLTIPVGVSYSSDTDKVEKTLLKLARAHKSVLKEPAPQAWFRGFGDSTLDFELRVYIPSIEYMLPVRHDLHQQIFKTFRAEGIEIAFPQRDLHIRSADALKDLIQRGDDPPRRERAPAELQCEDAAKTRP
ncbi:MAG: mechanosensitive ion channel [Phycisphaerales bacterium]